MIGSEIRDKDGVAATVRPSSLPYDTSPHVFQVFFAGLAVELERRGMTVSQYLTSLYGKYVLSMFFLPCL